MTQTLRRLLVPFTRFFLWDLIVNRRSRPLFIWAGSLIVIGSFLFRQLEGWSWLDSIYFSVVTLTTVGYGDLTPTQPVTKIITIFYILNGIGILMAFINEAADIRKERVKERVASHSRD